MHENSENTIIITGPRSPLMPSLRTYVYAAPAPKPDSSPAKAGMLAIPAVGFITSTAPKNATATIAHSFLVAFSFRMIADIIIAKNGDILLSTLASAIAI